MSYDFNLVAIGAGSAGLVSSYIAATLKAKVALVERHKMGGDCLNTGCVPSKALIRSAHLASMIDRHEEFGFKSASADIDFSRVMERVQRVISKVEPHDSVERYSKLGVDCIQGNAFIKSPHEIDVDGKIITTKNIIIATGAKPFVPPIPGLNQCNYYTTDTIWELREKPEHLVILGGGPIGSELTQAFNRLGVRVSQIEKNTQILTREDDEISKFVQDRFVKEGVELHLNSQAKEVKVTGDKKYLIIEKDGQEENIEFSHLLIAVGRQPNTSGFGLEELGVEINDRGALITNAYAQTSIPNIFACGDVTSKYQFTHMAAHGAYYATRNALFGWIPFAKAKINHSVVPWCTYTDPEIARVGLNEKEAKAKGIAYEVTTYNVDDLDRAIAEEEDYGLVKVLTVPGKKTILGVTICSYHAGDIIPEYNLAMTHGLNLGDIMSTIHIYPTMGEANKYAAGEWAKAHKPEGILNFLAKIHKWKRS